VSEVENTPVPGVPAVTAQTSVVAHDTTWKGDLESDGSVHVHGRVEGSIRAKFDVFIAEEADVDATVTATNVIIAGLIQGSIRCGDRFEVLPQGRVSGDINAPTLVIHEGAHVTGQFRMGTEQNGVENKPTSVVQRRAARGSA
jgi:cytoskeletal protein CcmA (bactofilin family)